MVNLITAEGIGSTVSAGVDKLWFYTTVGLVIAAVLVGVWWWNKQRSYNWDVIIKRKIGESNGFAFDFGYKGKHYWNNTKEMRFEIKNAKKLKIQYNNEPIDRKYQIEAFRKGKRFPLVIMESDSENFLHPVLLSPSEREVVISRMVDGKEKQVTVKVSDIEADMSNADITFAASEMENLAQKYLEKPLLEKYGFILFALMLLGAGALYWYGAKTNSEAVNSMASAMGNVASTNAQIAKLLEIALGNATNTTATTGLIAVG